MSLPIVANLDHALLPVAMTVTLGYLWRRTEPGGLRAVDARYQINQLVMYLFYPAMVLSVVTAVPLSADVLWVPALTAAAVLFGVITARCVFALPIFAGLSRPQLGALLLAGGFSNMISLGVPVLQAIFGPASARYAIYGDVLAIAPLLWILGAWIGLRYADGGKLGSGKWGVARILAKLPPIWAFVIAILLNLAGVRFGGGFAHGLDMLGNATIPCMLLTVGMSLSFGRLIRYPGVLFASSAIKLVLVPAFVFALGSLCVGDGELLRATVIENGMPTMMATVIISELFGLDTEMLAVAMVGSTLLFFGTIGFWVALWG